MNADKKKTIAILALVVFQGLAIAFLFLLIMYQAQRTNKVIEELGVQVLSSQNRTETKIRDWDQEIKTVYMLAKKLYCEYDSLNVEVDRKLKVIRRYRRRRKK